MNKRVIESFELYHFNPNHDPATGQFSKKSGLSPSSSTKKKPPMRKVLSYVDKTRSSFDTSKEGSELLEKANTAFDEAVKAYNDESYDESYEKARTKIAEYVDKQARHTMTKLIEKYGVDSAAEYASKYRGIENCKGEDDLIRQYVDWELHANGVDDIRLAHSDKAVEPMSASLNRLWRDNKMNKRVIESFELYHFNPNHDPATGQFSKGHGGLSKVKQSRAQKKLNKQAAKDADKYLSAKMAYGEGSGTRRKLVKAELEEKMKNPEYEKAFQEALSRLDKEEYAKMAVVERNQKDAAAKAKKATKAAMNVSLGTVQFANSAANGMYVFSRLI